jgi:hypothetical protein
MRSRGGRALASPSLVNAPVVPPARMGGMLLEIIMRREIHHAQQNLFDYARGRSFSETIAQDPSMFEAIIASLIVFSVGILVAHALDALRP